MNIEHLRRALKSEWLTYYRTNRDWIIKLGVWVNCQGQRRPSSSFILGVLTSLEPQLTQLLPLVVDLNCNPDRIVTALGLNFNPEDELAALAELESPAHPLGQTGSRPNSAQSRPKLLPSSSAPIAASPTAPYLEPAIHTNPFVQPGAVDFTQPDSTQSDQAKSSPVQPSPAQPSPAQPSPAKPARRAASTTRRSLDTAQLSARELPDRETAPRRSRNRRS
ncbi:MAG: DUF5331 domain-containing protein [Elainella sp.]